MGSPGPNDAADDAEVASRRRAIVDGLRRGDPAAFDRAYAEHSARIHGFLVRLTGRRDLADDLFQETFLRLARNATRLQPDTDLAAWLFTVARNLFLNYRRFILLDDDRLRALHLAPPARPPDSPETRAAIGQESARLLTALGSLPPHHREVLLLVAVEGLSHETAASILGCREDALRKRLERARVALTEAMVALDGARAKSAPSDGKSSTLVTGGGPPPKGR